ncbi:MAG: hypothetical protein KZQ88_09000 [Candidatus Thiodiazotropha sp. (ex Dulcina madagascariensis)]|nr:hypothetical protein [Candidatus Thiodiazotropha sp. (ex Dulcina madagascariensis)]MCU7925404.1 hypothetical protein [Candidatus Thiodiazotropha sp. (ex Dulcina madagascariensis)]
MLLRRMFTTLLLLPLSCLAEPSTWQGALQDGSRISIDHNTNKVTRIADGVTTPLWNGVHQLNNGAVIIVRDGVVVKDRVIIEAQHEQEHDRLNAACMQLVRKVCGPHNECDTDPTCDPARQLLAMERNELNDSWSGTVLESSTQCLEALGNEGFFQICNRRQPGSETPCEKLRLKVCGNDNQCGARQACDAARQLITMELQDLHSAPSGFTYAGNQCQDALTNVSAFFQACD